MDDDLLRRAYGAGATEAERADALAELERRRAVVSEAEPAADAVPVSTPTQPAAEARRPEGRPSSGGASDLAPAPTGRPPYLLLAAAVVVGALAGHAVAATEVAETTAADPANLSVATAPAMRVFDRPETARDAVTPAVRLVDGLDLTTVRALRAGASEQSLGIYGVRTIDGEDVCLVVTAPSGAERDCTEGGRFPPDGLQVQAPSTERIELAVVTWRADGSLGVRASNSASGSFESFLAS